MGRNGIIVALCLALACKGGDGFLLDDGGGETQAAESDTESETTATETGEETGDEGPKLDVGPPDGGDTGGIEMCKVIDDMDAIGDCEDEAPPDSFDPELQWTWTGPDGDVYSIVTPLVANLTDDDDNDEIDLCDVPDVVVVASEMASGTDNPGRIWVVDGATGVEHFRMPGDVDVTVTPAIGDVDGDGISEIVSARVGGNVVVFEHDGEVKWESPVQWPMVSNYSGVYSAAFGLADLDNDEDVEIYAANFVMDHEGTLVDQFPNNAGNWSATTAADLDGDEDLEIVLGASAYHHDGTPVYEAALPRGYPQIADLDDDGEPEVLLTNENGATLLEADGTVIWQDQRPSGTPDVFDFIWLRPATVHDFDGDDAPEFAMSSMNTYFVAETDASLVWMADVLDYSGIAAGTAFDFLGDGVAEAMYADESEIFVFDGGDGSVLLQSPRKSATLSEYPIVVDVDDDGSAEILWVSNEHDGGGQPTLQVLRDEEDRWIQARRIWNQHTYHVTNVREDGTVPQYEPPHWESLNTFRTNAQIEDGGVCKPPPPG